MKNVNSLIKVAEWLEAGAKEVIIDGHHIGRFDMEHSVSYESCGTTCCIAGAIVQFEGLIEPLSYGDRAAEFFSHETGVGPLAADHLGLNIGEAEMLFQPWVHFEREKDFEFSDPQRAAKVVRNLIATGEIDWNKFPPSHEFVDVGED